MLMTLIPTCIWLLNHLTSHTNMTNMAAWNVWKASFLPRQPHPYGICYPSAWSKLHLLTLSRPGLRLSSATKNFNRLHVYMYFCDQFVMITMQHIWVLYLNTHIELALYEYYIIIITIILPFLCPCWSIMTALLSILIRCTPMCHDAWFSTMKNTWSCNLRSLKSIYSIWIWPFDIIKNR